MNLLPPSLAPVTMEGMGNGVRPHRTNLPAYKYMSVLSVYMYVYVSVHGCVWVWWE